MHAQAAMTCSPTVAEHLTASTFLRFRRGADGAVSAAALFDYLGRRAAMLQLVRACKCSIMHYGRICIQLCCCQHPGGKTLLHMVEWET